MKEGANLQKMFSGLQDLGSAEEHGHMRIVATSMHFTSDLALVLPLDRLLEFHRASNLYVS